MRFGTFTPAQRIFRDAATARQALASQWLSAAQVSQGLGYHAPNGSHLVSQLRRAGKLLGVYVTHPSPATGIRVGSSSRAASLWTAWPRFWLCCGSSVLLSASWADCGEALIGERSSGSCRPTRRSMARLHPKFWPRIPAAFCGPRVWSFGATPDGAADALGSV